MIYPPLADQTTAHTRNKQHHNTVFFNTSAWGSHPYASPEEPGTTPSEICQRWSTERPLGVAMRLTALRQPPKDSPRPMNLMLKKRKTTANDLPSPHLCNCTNLPPKIKKHRKTGQYGPPQGGAVQAPQRTDLHYPLTVLST